MEDHDGFDGESVWGRETTETALPAVPQVAKIRVPHMDKAQEPWAESQEPAWDVDDSSLDDTDRKESLHRAILYSGMDPNDAGWGADSHANNPDQGGSEGDAWRSEGPNGAESMPMGTSAWRTGSGASSGGWREPGQTDSDWIRFGVTRIQQALREDPALSGLARTNSTCHHHLTKATNAALSAGQKLDSGYVVSEAQQVEVIVALDDLRNAAINCTQLLRPGSKGQQEPEIVSWLTATCDDIHNKVRELLKKAEHTTPFADSVHGEEETAVSEGLALQAGLESGACLPIFSCALNEEFQDSCWKYMEQALYLQCSFP